MKFPEILIGKPIDPFLSVPGWQHREQVGLAGGCDSCQYGKPEAEKSLKPSLSGHLVTSERLSYNGQLHCFPADFSHRGTDISMGQSQGYYTDRA